MKNTYLNHATDQAKALANGFVPATWVYLGRPALRWAAAGLLLLLLFMQAGAHAATTINSISPVTILEDALTTNSFNGVSGTNTIAVTAASSNTSVISNLTVNYTSPATNGTVVYQPVANAVGSATITLTVADSESTNTTSYVVTVTEVNDAPSFTLSTNTVVVTEDAGAQTISNFATNMVLGPSSESGQTFSFLVTTSPTTSFSAQPAISTNGHLTFTWATNKYGTNTVTVRMVDSGGTASGGLDRATNTFTLVSSSVNDLPSMDLVSSTNINEDAGTVSIAFTVSDPDDATLTFTSVSSDTNIITSTISGSGGSRKLNLKTVANAYGTVTNTVIVNDGEGTTTNTVEVTVAAVNDAPVGSAILAKTILEDAGATNFTITVSDVDGDVTNITVTATSSNTDLVANTNLVLSGTSTNRTLAITAFTNAFGKSTISLVFADDAAKTSTNTFVLTVTGVNDQPNFTLATNLFILAENAGAVSFPGIVGSVELGPTNESSQGFAYTVTASSNTFFQVRPALATNGTLTFTVKTNVSGFASAKVVLKDKGGTANGGRDSYTNTLYIAVTNINNAPVIAGATDRSLYEDQATNMNLTLTDLDHANLQLSATSGNTDLLDVAVSGTGSARVLRLIPAANTNGGPVTVTLIASDGASNTTNTFTVTILAVNDAPSFTLSAATLTVAEDAGAISVTNFLTSPSLGPSDENAQTFTYSVTAAQTNYFSVQPAIATNGLLTFTLAADKAGTNLLTVRMVDSGGTANKGLNTATNSFRLIVTNVNDAPTISEITAKTYGEDFKKTNITFTVADIDTAVKELTVTSVSSDTNLVTVSVTGSTAARTLVLTSVTNAAGSATITNIVSDGALTATNTVAITITAVNDAPAISALAVKTIDEDSGVTNITFTISDVDTDLTNVTTTAFLANTNLASVTVTNADSTNRVLVLTPSTNAFGSTLVSVVASDGDKSATNRFTLTLSGINDAPSFALSTNLVVVTEDAGAQSVSAFVASVDKGPTNESSQTITYVLTSSDASFFKKLPAISAAGVLTYTTATNKYGTNTITVYAKDSGGTNSGGVNVSASTNFSIVVNNVNDAPSLPALKSKTIFEDSGATNITFTVVDGDTDLTNVTVTATCSKTNLASVTATNAGGSFYVTVTPTSNTNSSLVGSAAITIVASDGSLSATNSFMLSVTAVNDAPSFDLATNSVTADHFLAVHTVSGLLTNVAAGPTSDENSQKLTAKVTVDNASYFVGKPTLTTNGVLTFKTSTNSGTAVLTITLSDSGGTRNGGVAESAGQTLNVVIPSTPFDTLTGDYNGLFYETNGVNHTRSGFVNFNVNRYGIYTGYLLLAGASNKFTGQFAIDDGATALAISNASVNVNMDLTIDLTTNETETISGTVTNSTWQAELLAVKSLYGTTNVVNEIGNYTLVLPGASDPATAPGGDGIAWVTVDDNGLITMSGLMGDGTSVSQQVGISKYGEWPLYARLYQKGTNGSILTWVTFNLTNQYSAIESNAAVWTKLSAAAGTNYTGGFTNSTYPIASAYSAWEDMGVTSGTVILNGGNLSAAITNTVTVGYNSIVVDPSATNKLTLTLDPASGYISGSFVDPTRNATNLIHAIILQQTNVARGYFLGTNQSGSFILK